MITSFDLHTKNVLKLYKTFKKHFSTITKYKTDIKYNNMFLLLLYLPTFSCLKLSNRKMIIYIQVGRYMKRV